MPESELPEVHTGQAPPFARAFGGRIVFLASDRVIGGQIIALLSSNYQVEAVSDGAGALEAARRRPPDLILCDIGLPQRGGPELLKAVRADELLRDIPFILLADPAGEQSWVEGMEAGADEYLVRPVSGRQLLVRVGALLELTRMRRENVGVHTDVTDIREANVALLDADRRKDEALATLAHELRNPLAPIRNAALILQTKAADTPARELAVAIIQRQVQSMALLLDELLDISRITRGSLVLQVQRVSLKAVLDNALEIARPMITARRHELDIHLPPGPVEIDADPLRLSQAVANLLTNAAKYTDPGGHIELGASVDESGVTVVVKDSGIGLEPESLAGIFAMFSQVKGALSRSEGGLGIGLALVKGLVELHGGTVAASSGGLGQGSEFRVHLPQQAPWGA